MFLREGTLFVVVLFLHEIVPEVETGIQMHFRLKPVNDTDRGLQRCQYGRYSVS